MADAIPPATIQRTQAAYRAWLRTLLAQRHNELCHYD